MADKTLVCYDCGAEFIFTEGEQAFYAERNFSAEPRKCPECRKDARESRKSRKLKEFVKEIQYINRNPMDNSVLEMLKDISTNPTITINSGEYLYRARNIEDMDKTNKKSPFWGYSKDESFVPPRNVTRDMRANYRYIPYLYCSNSPYVALCEVRPRLGTAVSIAKIIINEKLEIFDLTLAKKPIGIKQPKIHLCDDLSIMFSKPLMHDDDIINYIPTQYIAEYIKNLGYSGIKYYSAFNNNGYIYANFVIFKYSRCEPLKSNIFIIENQLLHYKKHDQDDENLFDIFIKSEEKERFKETWRNNY